jgi:hypothetical protein
MFARHFAPERLAFAASWFETRRKGDAPHHEDQQAIRKPDLILRSIAQAMRLEG